MVINPSTVRPIASYACTGSAGTVARPFVASWTVRPHNPPEVLTACCQSRTPSVNPRSRSGSTSNPRVIDWSVTPGPVTRPSGVTGTMVGVVVAGPAVAVDVRAGSGPS